MLVLSHTFRRWHKVIIYKPCTSLIVHSPCLLARGYQKLWVGTVGTRVTPKLHWGATTTTPFFFIHLACLGNVFTPKAILYSMGWLSHLQRVCVCVCVRLRAHTHARVHMHVCAHVHLGEGGRERDNSYRWKMRYTNLFLKLSLS